jgi:hypothetical protein
MNSLAGHRLPAGRDMPFGGQIRPGLCAFGGDPPVLAKGTPPFLEALPETFNRTGGWGVHERFLGGPRGKVPGRNVSMHTI